MKRKATDSPGPGALRPTAVHFVRHGEVYNPEKVYYGRLPGFHLSTAGFEEAAAVGPKLLEAVEAASDAMPSLREGPPPAVLHSPLLRARETAEVAMAATKAPLLPDLHEDPRLLEVCLPYEGRPISDLVDIGFDKLYDHGQPAYEDFAQVFARVRGLVASLATAAEAPASRHVFCFCHGDICMSARLWARKGAAAVTEGRFKRADVPYPGHCSVTTLLVDDAVGAAAWPEKVRWLQEAEADRAAAAAKAAAAQQRAKLAAEAEERRKRWRAGERGHTPLE